MTRNLTSLRSSRERTGCLVVIATIELENHRAENFRAFERAIAGLDEVVACWSLGGGYDYLMQEVTRDVAAYQAVIDPLLEPRVGLKRYFSYIVTKEVKGGGVPPFDVLLGANGST